MAPRSAELQSQTLRQAKADRWRVRFWLFLAWLVAIDRLRIAVARREVFDMQDALAFIVAAAMPIGSARRIAAALSEMRAALHAGFVARRSRDAAPVVPKRA